MDSVRPTILKTKRSLNCVKSSSNKDTAHINKNASSLMDYTNLRKTPNKTLNIKQNNVVFLSMKDVAYLVTDATSFTRKNSISKRSILWKILIWDF